MTKQILEKITRNRTPLGIADISVEEKKELRAYMASKGFSEATFYLRFFQKGFDLWEIYGINECKKHFLELPEVAELLLAYVDNEDPSASEGDKGYFYTLAHSDDAGVFYQCLKKVNSGLCKKFFAFMDERGMSAATVIKRFTTEEWKEWERTGIRTVLENFSTK